MSDSVQEGLRDRPANPSQEMIDAGALVVEEMRDRFPSFFVAQQVYIAMESLRRGDEEKAAGAGLLRSEYSESA